MSADLGALVASPHFVWMWGMLTSKGRRVLLVHPDHGLLCHDMLGAEARWCWPEDDETLDLDDPGSRGCLRHLVREAWGDPTICVQHRGGVSTSVDAWLVTTESTPEHYGKGHFSGATEAEALTAALLAAPPKETS